MILLLADYVKHGESYIAYLPLARKLPPSTLVPQLTVMYLEDILEFVVEMAMFYVGAPMGYGTVKTLTDTNMKNCLGDMRAFQPTIMVGVPAVWELIRKGINTKVHDGGALKSKVFNAALAAKKASPSILGPITDAAVFKAVRQATGGKLKYALSGGAMISKETHEFLRLALTNLIQGYGLHFKHNYCENLVTRICPGMTESCGCVHT